MRIAVTGADGFLGRNLCVHLGEHGHTVLRISRTTSADEWAAALSNAEFVFHLAGVNRPPDVADFDAGNRALTERICAALTGRPIPLLLASSVQATLDNPYGRSKRAAETAVETYGRASGAPVYIARLPNVFGKWSRPHYNSVVATFCHNVARGNMIDVHDPAAELALVYVDDVMATFLALTGDAPPAAGFIDVGPVHRTTVGGLASLIRTFGAIPATSLVPDVGAGLTRALYATYVSYLPPEKFSYALTQHTDARGAFVEVVKNGTAGQCSFFTALAGVTRGGHYHHTKTEKFVVVRGRARFRFRHVTSGETHELIAEGTSATVVETVPGWAHDITNIGTDELIVLLWANEVYDPARPDTIVAKVSP